MKHLVPGTEYGTIPAGRRIDKRCGVAMDLDSVFVEGLYIHTHNIFFRRFAVNKVGGDMLTVFGPSRTA